jgi:hypothetical protein
LLRFFFFNTGVQTQGLTLARQVLSHLSHSTSYFFVLGIFRDRLSRTIYPGWLWTTILLISVSWVTRITGLNHRHPALTVFVRQGLTT